jgi:hypothetical protein
MMVREKKSQSLVAAQIGASFHLRHETFAPHNFGAFHESRNSD